MSCRNIILGGTSVILGASGSWSGLCNFTWITKKACSLWTRELARSSLCDYFKLSGHTMVMPSMVILCSGHLGEALPLGSESLAVTEAPPASHFHRAWFMGRWGWCRLILYGPIKLSISGTQEGAVPGIRFGLLCLWPVLGHKFEVGGQSDCQLLRSWMGSRRRRRRRGVGNTMKRECIASAPSRSLGFRSKKKYTQKMDFSISYFSMPLQTPLW